MENFTWSDLEYLNNPFTKKELEYINKINRKYDSSLQKLKKIQRI